MVTCASVTGFLVYQTAIPQAIIKQTLEKEFTKTFGWKVTIESLSGNLLTGISLDNIKFSDNPKFPHSTILTIDHATIYYNPIKALAQKKGDFAAATYWVQLENVRLNAIRDKADQWNILELIPKAPPGAKNKPPQPPTFVGKITAKNMQVWFTDELGWSKETPLKTPFRDNIIFSQGTIDFNKLDAVAYKLVGTLLSSRKPTVFKGNFSAFDGQYVLNIRSGMGLNRWGNYVLPLEKFSIEDDTVTVEGTVKSKFPFPKPGIIPFWYNLTLTSLDTTFRMPFFEEPVKHIKTKAKLMHGIIPKEAFSIGVPSGNTSMPSEEIWTQLKKAGILDKDGQLLTYISSKHPLRLLPDRLLPYKEQIRNILIQPPVIFSLPDFSASFYGVPIKGDGQFFLDRGIMSMALKTESFELACLKKMFEGIKTWKLSGAGSTTLTIHGSTNAPIVEGILTAPNVTLYALKPTQVQSNYRFENKRLTYHLLKGNLYGGILNGQGEINFNNQPADLGMTLTLLDMDTQKTFSKSSKIITGHLDLTTQITGNVDTFTATTLLHPKSLRIMNQTISKAFAHYTVLHKNQIQIHTASMYLNESTTPITLTGAIQDLEKVKIHYAGQGTIFNSLLDAGKKPGVLDISGDYAALLNTNFWQNPDQESRTTADIILYNYPLYDKAYEHVDIAVSYQPHLVSIRKFVAKNKAEEIHLSGTLENKFPKDLKLSLISVEIPTHSAIQRYFPAVIKPLTGLITTDLEIQKNNKIKTPTLNPIAYNIKGSLSIQEGLLQNQPFDLISALFKWNGDNLTIESSQYHHQSSDILLNGTVNAEKQLDLTVKEGTTIDLKDFQILISPLGRLAGQWKVRGKIKGDVSDPEMNVWIKGENVKSNVLALDKIEGQLEWSQNRLKLGTVKLKHKDSDYTLSGMLDVSPVMKDRTLWKQIGYDLELTIGKSNINDISEFLQQINQEIKVRFFQKETMGEKIANANAKIEKPSNRYRLESDTYSGKEIRLFKVGSTQTSLGFFEEVERNQKALEKTEELGLGSLLAGNLTAVIKAKSRGTQNPLIEANIQAVNAKISFVTAKKISLVLNTDKDTIQYAIEIDQGSVGAETFKALRSKGSYGDDGNLTIKNTEIVTTLKTNPDVLKGWIPINAYWDATAKNKPMHLETTLIDNDIAILSIFNKNIKSISNQGKVALTLDGPLEEPVLNSQSLSLKNMQIFLAESAVFDKPFLISSNAISIIKNKVLIPKTPILWQRRDDTSKYNTFVVKGDIAVRDLNLLTPKTVILDFNLALDDGLLDLDLPAIYRGKAKLADMKLVGPYYLPLGQADKQIAEKNLSTDKEQGPLLSGMITLSNGAIILPTLGEKTIKPSYRLSVAATIGEEVSLAGGLLGEGFLAGLANSVSVEVNKTKEPLYITGTLNAPKIKNKVYLNEGTITFVNRSFTVLNEDRQRMFYKENQYKTHANALSFESKTQGNGKQALIPRLNITAYSMVEKPGITASSNSTFVDPDQFKAVLISMDGSIYDLDTLSFEKYKSLRSNPLSANDVEYENTYRLGKQGAANNQDTYQVFSLLMPDLVNSNLTQNTPGEDQTKRLLNVVGENQINSVVRQKVLRPVELQLARNIGLYDLRVDYNVGHAVLKSASDRTGYTGVGQDENVLGVNFMKQLITDKLFLRVKTDLDLKLEGNFLQTLSVSEVELRYYLLNNFSMTFSNIREASDTTSRPKFSLRYSYEY
ncbi:MAG: hypothetical protein EXS67_04080 [Candidatus Margulisbacteria bacterium]|nr:hypothetical protein [Candidatus Margulisiibacteriota bacterium]